MARMTDGEADALDELWTRTTPEIDTSKPGFLTRKGASHLFSFLKVNLTISCFFNYL
jgi:hypothetical protein